MTVAGFSSSDNMVTVCLRRKYYTIPQCWNELTGKQLVQIMSVFEKPLSPMEAKLALFRILFRLSWFRFAWMRASDMDDMLYLVNFMLESNTLTRTLLTRYRGLYGPDDGFNNMRVDEFILSETYYRNYEETTDPEQLNLLIATIYRPGKWLYNRHKNKDGDIRIPYNANLTPYYAHKVARWPMAVKLSILHWYKGCMYKMVEDFETVFSGKKGEPALHGLWTIMREVSRSHTQGPKKEVEVMYLHEFFMELTEIAAEAERREKEFKQPTS